MKEVNIGIIGLGAIGERLLQQFTAHPLTKVVAISDVNEERMEQLQQRLTDVHTFVDYRELIAEQSVDLVYVAVPPKFHHAIVMDVLEAGKHVLCEKPLANSLQEAVEMAAKAQEAGVVHAINFPLPYSNPVQLLAEKVRDGEIGVVKRIELTMQFPAWPREWQQNPWIAGREQGGFIREITPHYIQLIEQIFGSVEHVQSYVDYPADELACETGVIARMELADGTPILINGLSGIGKQEELAFRVYGQQGVLSLLNWGILTYESLDGEQLEVERETNHPGLIDELIKALNGEPAQLITFDQGLAVQKTLESLL